MSTLEQDRAYFEQVLALAERVHNSARLRFGPRSPEGHFINQNTVIRICEAADEIRDALGRVHGTKPNWYESKDRDAICYIVLRVYRNCILHNRGKMQSHFDGPELRPWKSKYEALCRDIELQPHTPQQDILLPGQPMIQRLLDGIKRFVRNQLVRAGSQTASTC